MVWVVLFSTLIWVVIFMHPWAMWRVGESIKVTWQGHDKYRLDDICVLIPARNEADNLPKTLLNLNNQGQGLKIIVIDDESTDNTANIVERVGLDNVELVSGAPLPNGWMGKMWALQQGIQHVDRPFTLLLDADISLGPGTIWALKQKMHTTGSQMVSVMAKLSCNKFIERLFIPAFVYFFKLIYPFKAINSPHSSVAGAAGGCIFINTATLNQVGAFSALRHAVIDDCELAKLVKRGGNKIWLGFCESVVSERMYSHIGEIWHMVKRTAFTQLNYSWPVLFACIVFMCSLFVLPVFCFFQISVGNAQFCLTFLGLICVVLMCLTYWPTIRYLEVPWYYVFSLPLTATIYMLITLDSAFHYLVGERTQWRGRRYVR